MPASRTFRGVPLVATALLFAGGAALAADSAAAPARPPKADAERGGTLGTREMILVNQVGFARGIARWRARELYRLMQSPTQLSGAPLPPGDRARAVSAGVAALGRDLHEHRVLAAELTHVRADRAVVAQRATVPAAASGPTPAAAPRPPSGYMAPVGGPVDVPFGAARDASGVWLFRGGLRLRARAGEPIKVPADGTVRRVVDRGPWGTTVVMSHDGGVVTIVTGVGQARAAPGQRLQRGETLGTVAAPRNVGTGKTAVDIEVWLGTTPVDPAPILNLRSPTAARR